MALRVVMLLALSAMRMAFADALSLPPQALNSQNVVQISYLRSTADVAKSEQVDNGEGRRLVISFAGLEGLPARLHQSVIKIFEKLRLRWWLWQQEKKTPNDAFKALELDKVKGSIFASPKFSAWKVFVEKNNLGKDNALRVMFETMEKQFGEANLVNVLCQAKGLHGDTVERLRDYQIKRWIDDGETVESVFDRLNLKQQPEKRSDIPKFAKQFDGTEFTIWGKFIMKTRSDYAMAFNHLKGPKGKSYDLMRALTGTTGENVPFAVDLLYSRLSYLQLKGEHPIELYQKLNLQEVVKKQKLSNDDELRVWIWLHYTILRLQDDDVTYDQVSQHINTIFGNIKGKGLIKGDIAEKVDKLKEV